MGRRAVARGQLALPGLLLAAWLAAGPAARGAEPFREFLEGLRRREMYDVALDYLAQCRQSPLISQEIKSTLDYEEARLLIDGARSVQDLERRMAQLDEARAKFEQFLAANSAHPLAGAARVQMGNVLVERGRTQMERAQRPANAQRREALLDESRQLFTAAEQVFGEAEAQYQAALDAFPKFISSQESQRLAARDRARLDLLQAQLYRAQVLFERARSHPRESDASREFLTQAAEKYRALYDQNRRLFAGLYARMWQGRCQQELGNLRQALSYYGDLLVQPDEPEAYRTLKAQTLRLAMECWLADSERKFDEAIRQGEAWLGQARPDEQQSADGLSIRWSTAQAHEARAREAELDAATRRQDHQATLRHAEYVARAPGPYQKAARELIARLKNTEVRGDPRSFADAREAGRAALDEMESHERKRGAAEDASAAAELALAAGQARQAAIEHFRRALTLADDELPSDERNQLRYFLCYLYYQAGAFYDSALLGQFLADRYPEAAGARPAARIALAAWLQAYNAAPPEQRGVEAAQLNQIARLIADRWAGGAEADEAWSVQADLALRDKQFAQAAAYLAHVSESSPKRGEADLKAGQALWAAYIAQAAVPDAEASAAQAREQTLAEAQRLLEQGIAQTRESLAGSAVLAGAELSLAQLYVQTSAFERAVELLERPEQGPLALAATQHPLAQRGQFALETYKAALQAYVGAQSLDKAEQVMAQLDAQTAASPSGGNLTSIYVSLGRDLERQVARLREAGDQAALDRVLQSFELFLDKIASHAGAVNFHTLSWVAQTYVALGEGVAPRNPSRAKGYFERAAKAFEQVIAKSASPGFAPQDEAVTSARIQLARTERLLGNYQEALDALVAILKERPAMLDAQVEAALTYQAWGAVDPVHYQSAIQGGRRARRADGSTMNIVWGWHKLAAVVQANPKFQDVYYQACYELAHCALAQAAGLGGDQRTKALASAKAILEQLALTRPALGGEQWAARFQALWNKVHRELGETAPPLGQPPAAARSSRGVSPARIPRERT